MSILFKILFGLIFIVIASVMIILERDKPKNIIIWVLIFLVFNFLGGIVYFVLKIINAKKRNALTTKQVEDNIYDGLISNKLLDIDVKTNDDFLNFNKLAYNANFTKNNIYEMITDYASFMDSLNNEINSAKKYIVIEVSSMDKAMSDSILTTLISKLGENVKVKIIYGKGLNRAFIKSLKAEGAKAYKFCKYDNFSKSYTNQKNIIMIDGRVVFLGNFSTSKNASAEKYSVANTYIKLKGDAVQDIDVSLHQDVMFASGKYWDYTTEKAEKLSNDNGVQTVVNSVKNDAELLFIKAICMAKKSITLQLSEFIPTESIMSLLHFAINSNIDVRLMVPIKNDSHGKYYATRAYAKELALFGANVYLYDGYISANTIVIDSKYCLMGSYSIDRTYISNSLQSILVFDGARLIKNANDFFDECVENSYRISNAKVMLLREKFFKNFV